MNHSNPAPWRSDQGDGTYTVYDGQHRLEAAQRHPGIAEVPAAVVLLEQVRTIDKRRLREHMGHVDEGTMNRVDSAIAVSFGLSGMQ